MSSVTTRGENSAKYSGIKKEKRLAAEFSRLAACSECTLIFTLLKVRACPETLQSVKPFRLTKLWGLMNTSDNSGKNQKTDSSLKVQNESSGN